jgi:hypothetical protein
MASGCGGASQGESCRDGGGGGGDGGDGGGVDVPAEPCPNWVPFSRVDGARPWTLRGCGDACDLCSGSSRATVLARAWMPAGCRCRWCDVSRNPSQRVAPATLAWGRRRCALEGAP